jgi:hypothetical protein
LASEAFGATGFAPAETLAGAGAATGTVASAMAPNGVAIAAWVEALPGGQSAVRVSVRPPGGPWSSPQQLDRGGPSKTAYPVSVAIDAAGNAAVAWDDETVVGTTPFDSTVVSTAAVGHAFGVPQTISAASDPAVGIDGVGQVTLIDTEGGVSHNEVVRAWAVGGSVPTMGQQLGTGCGGTVHAQLAVAPTGDAIAGLDCNGATFALRRSGTWAESTPFPFSSTSCMTMFGFSTLVFSSDVRVAIDSQGNAAAVVLEDRGMTECSFAIPSDTYTVNLVLQLGNTMQAVTPAVATASSFGFIGSSLASPDIAVGGGSELVSWGPTRASSS